MTSRRRGTAIDDAFTPIKLEACYITIEKLKLNCQLGPVTLVVCDGSSELVRVYAHTYNDMWVTFPIREFTKRVHVAVYHNRDLTLERLFGKATMDITSNKDHEPVTLSLGTGIGFLVVKTNVKRLYEHATFDSHFDTLPNPFVPPPEPTKPPDASDPADPAPQALQVVEIRPNFLNLPPPTSHPPF